MSAIMSTMNHEPGAEDTGERIAEDAREPIAEDARARPLICTIGDLILDVVVLPKAPLAPDGDTPATIRLTAGGQAANVAAWASALGARSRLICVRGSDESSEIAAAHLEHHGVELWGPVIEGTGGVVVSTRGVDGARTMVSDPGVTARLTPGALDEAWVRSADVLHVSGYCLLRDCVAEAAIAGSSEAPFSMGMLKAWEAMRIVAPDTCRPFSRDRKGLILGEGAAMLVLEPMESALARGAKIWGEIAGFGMSSDAYHLTQPLADGAARAMRGALQDAGADANAVGYINAHGTGTQANDVTEAQAIREVFGAHADKIAVSSTKSMHGHALGAAGALEAAATLMALDESMIPPTANFTEADPACTLDVVPNVARAASIKWALSNSFAFGGLNAVLAFRRAKR